MPFRLCRSSCLKGLVLRAITGAIERQLGFQVVRLIRALPINVRKKFRSHTKSETLLTKLMLPLLVFVKKNIVFLERAV